MAAKSHHPRLPTLAHKIQLHVFTHVKLAIDHIIAELPKEKDYQIKHNDFCTEEFNHNQLQTEEKGREKFDPIGMIQDLKISIRTPADHIQGLKADIAKMQVQLKHAGEDRVKEHKEL